MLMSVHRKLRDTLSATAHEHADYERFVRENTCAYAMATKTDEHFSIRATAYSSQDFTITRFTTRAGKSHVERGPAEIRQDNHNRYAIYLPLAGALQVQQLGRDERYEPGSIAFVSTAEACSTQKMGDNDTIYFMMPQDFVDQRLIGAETACGRKVMPPEGMRNLCIETISALHGSALTMSSGDLAQTSRLVGELVLMSLSSSVDMASSSSPVRAANLARAKRIIRKRCVNPDLTLSDIAKECGLSLRYLHDLFQDDGRTFREYMMNERLSRAYRMLEIGPPATTRVTDVCVASGFSNLSHFSTAFRRTFCCSPRDIILRNGMKS